MYAREYQQNPVPELASMCHSIQNNIKVLVHAVLSYASVCHISTTELLHTVTSENVFVSTILAVIKNLFYI